MADQEVIILGSEEHVLMLAMLGIEGKVVEKSEEFLKIFRDLIKKPSVGMIIIALDLPKDIMTYLIDFKINNKRPFIFIMPNLFKTEIDKEDLVLNRILDAISDIV
ncbi:MAG: V-type ATP synthase subunit F [Promethearchaeota archaeon]|jgi:vacuolar-type H+-ATPase subunit F/Vma7